MKFHPIKIGAARDNISKFGCGPPVKKVAYAWFRIFTGKNNTVHSCEMWTQTRSTKYEVVMEVLLIARVAVSALVVSSGPWFSPVDVTAALKDYVDF